MKLKITLTSSNVVVLPKEFNIITQAVIYRFLDRLPAKWLHDTGFEFEKRSFKLFVFSSFLEKAVYSGRNYTFTFPDVISFYISSPVTWILEQFAKNIVVNEKLMLGNITMKVSSLEVFKDEVIEGNRIRISTLTPIEVHSTLTKGDGKKKTYYYSPTESEYSELINENLRKKWVALNNEECPHTITIVPVNIKLCRERVRMFKDIVIKGWAGHFWLEGHPEFLQFALLTGLGSRNSMGFGFVEVVRKKQKLNFNKE